MNDTETVTGNVYRCTVFRLADHFIHNTVNRDAFGSQLGIFCQGQIRIDRDHIAVVGLLNLNRTVSGIDDQRIVRTRTKGYTGTIRNDRHIAAVGLNIFKGLILIAVYQFCCRGIHGDGNALILSRYGNLADGIVSDRCGIHGNNYVGLGVIRSFDDTIGLYNHFALGHFEAGVSICIFVDNQIGSPAIADSSRCTSEIVRTGNIGSLRLRAFTCKVPVPSCHIGADFRCQPLQFHFLVFTDGDLGHIVRGRCNGVEDGIGLCYRQGCQNAIVKLSQDVAHPQIQLAFIMDHTVGIVFQRTQLSQNTEILCHDIVRGVGIAIKPGGKSDLTGSILHQIHCQTGLGQIQVIRDPVTGRFIAGLGICGNTDRLDQNGILFRNGAINGQGGTAGGIDTAGTEHQDTAADIRRCDIALGFKSCSTVGTSGYLTAMIRISIGKLEDLIAGGLQDYFLVSAQIVIGIRIGIVSCFTVNKIVANRAVGRITVLGKALCGRIRKIIDCSVSRADFVEQRFTFFQTKLCGSREGFTI